MLPLDFHPLVEADLAGCAKWDGRQQPGLEEQFLTEGRARFAALSAEALLYAARVAENLRVNLPGFKCGVFYFIAVESIVVLAVLSDHCDSQAELQRCRKKYS